MGPNLKLRTSVTLIVALTTCLALLLAYVASMFYADRFLERSLTSNASILAQWMDELSGAALASEDPDAAEEVLLNFGLEALSADPNIVSVRILALDGTVLAEYGRHEPHAASTSPARTRRSLLRDHRTSLSRPISVDGQQVATIQVESRASGILAWLSRYAPWVVLGILVGSTCFALLLSARLKTVVTDPIEQLAAIARRVSADQDFSVRAPAADTVELKELVGTFNAMLDLIQETEARLLHDALHDGLTGLPNRTSFVALLDRELARIRDDPSYSFGLLFVDVDNFKMVNDSFGHISGDQVLVEIGRRLLEFTRRTDTVARLGGDEFTILVDEIATDEDAIRYAERIHAVFETPIEVGGSKTFASVSIGIVLGSAEYKNAGEALRAANTAMHHAKSERDSSCKIFDPEMHQRAVERLKTETDLQQALANREFRVHYQPIVSLEDGSVSGFEALVRWQHPLRALLSPGRFLDIALETDMIVSIDRWVLREACRKMAQWKSQFGLPLRIHVNFARQQILQTDLPALVDEVLTETGLDADSLVLELTEEVFLDRRGVLIDTAFSLKEIGAHLAIDDFGTGYSSLRRLGRLPIDTLKIDRTFVHDMMDGAGQLEIVRTIMSLGQTLGMTVVAEGIETEVQLAQLQAMGIEEGQGFLFARPLTAFEAEALIEGRPPWLHHFAVPKPLSLINKPRHVQL